MRVAHNAVVDHVRKQKPSVEGIDHYADVELQPVVEVGGGKKLIRRE